MWETVHGGDISICFLVGWSFRIGFLNICNSFALRNLTRAPSFELEETVYAVHDHGDEAKELCAY